MSVLIRGMEMPTRCAECWLMDGEDSWCTACRGRHLYPEYRYGIKDRPDWCPLIHVPPHGDLIDRDAARASIKPWSPEDERNGCTFDTVKKLMYTMLDCAPTIIPAESITAKGEKNDK